MLLIICIRFSQGSIMPRGTCLVVNFTALVLAETIDFLNSVVRPCPTFSWSPNYFCSCLPMFPIGLSNFFLVPHWVISASTYNFSIVLASVTRVISLRICNLSFSVYIILSVRWKYWCILNKSNFDMGSLFLSNYGIFRCLQVLDNWSPCCLWALYVDW